MLASSLHEKQSEEFQGQEPGNPFGSHGSTRRTLQEDFNPPSDAEPWRSADYGEETEKEKPTVLTKLQKWANYESTGEPVGGSKFLPMKTPMSLEIMDNWSLEQPPLHKLTIPELLESQRKKNRRVGMIIDLANHECLYADDLPRSIEYAHVQLVAKVLPSVDAICKVQEVSQEFWSRKPDEYIAIHCAYGFNRTGFVLCSYLCQAMGLSVEEALETFASARPPGVKHEKFVQALFERYGTEQSGTLEKGGDSGNRDESSDATPFSQGNGLVDNAQNINVEYHKRSKAMKMRSAPSSVLRQQEAMREAAECSRSYNSTGVLESEDLDSMAMSLNFSSSMRRETSMGLAKALHVDFGHHDYHLDEKQGTQDHHGQLVLDTPVSPADIASGLYKASATHVINPSFGFSEEDALISLKEHKKKVVDGEMECGSNADDIVNSEKDGHALLEPSTDVDTNRGNGCCLM